MEEYTEILDGKYPLTPQEAVSLVEYGISLKTVVELNSELQTNMEEE